jgi:hypothetical protein
MDALQNAAPKGLRTSALESPTLKDAVIYPPSLGQVIELLDLRVAVPNTVGARRFGNTLVDVSQHSIEDCIKIT